MNLCDQRNFVIKDTSCPLVNCPMNSVSKKSYSIKFPFDQDHVSFTHTCFSAFQAKPFRERLKLDMLEQWNMFYYIWIYYLIT